MPTSQNRDMGHPAFVKMALNSLFGLLGSGGSWSDDSDVVHTGLMSVIDDVGYQREVQIGITFNEHRLVGSSGKDFGELRHDIELVHRGFVDLVRYSVVSVSEDLNDNCLRLIDMIRGFGGLR
jgi:hypothetical protein